MLRIIRNFLSKSRESGGLLKGSERTYTTTSLTTRELKNLVNHVEPRSSSWKSDDPQIQEVLCTSHSDDVKFHLTNFGKSLSQLRYTYGISWGTLEEFVEKELEHVARYLPQCKLITAKTYSYFCQLHLSKDIVSYASTRGLHLDREKDPETNPWLHQLVVDFGKGMCDKYPTVFRDIYFTCAHNVETMASNALRKGNHPLLGKRLEKEGFPHNSVMEAVEKLGEEYWYLSEQRSLQSRELFLKVKFLRGLDKTPFDPISASDVIHPEVQHETWEAVGLLFASGPFSSLDVIDGPVPVPVT